MGYFETREMRRAEPRDYRLAGLRILYLADLEEK